MFHQKLIRYLKLYFLEFRCSSPIGLATFQIPAESITASSTLGQTYHPTNGRLTTHLGHGSWCAAVHNDQQFLQVDLMRIYVITGFATQGKHRLSTDELGDAWVKSYKVLHSKDKFHWDYLQETNNTEVKLLFFFDFHSLLR
jgi:hypothetical protein